MKRKKKGKAFFCYNLKSKEKFIIMKIKNSLYEGLWNLPMIETDGCRNF